MPNGVFVLAIYGLYELFCREFLKEQLLLHFFQTYYFCNKWVGPNSITVTLIIWNKIRKQSKVLSENYVGVWWLYQQNSNCEQNSLIERTGIIADILQHFGRYIVITIFFFIFSPSPLSRNNRFIDIPRPDDLIRLMRCFLISCRWTGNKRRWLARLQKRSKEVKTYHVKLLLSDILQFLMLCRGHKSNCNSTYYARISKIKLHCLTPF